MYISLRKFPNLFEYENMTTVSEIEVEKRKYLKENCIEFSDCKLKNIIIKLNKSYKENYLTPKRGASQSVEPLDLYHSFIFIKMFRK